MLFIPNIIWAKNKPDRYEAYAQKENKILLALERIGEVLVCFCVLIFSDFNIRTTYWCIWLIFSFVFMLFYEIYWLRYFKSSRRMEDFYSSFLGIPVAGATLPVCAFFLLGIYGSNAFLLIAVVILGIGHIGIHLQHKNEILEKKRSLLICILKWIGAAVGIVLALTFIFVIGCRNINYLKHYQMVGNGVDEEIYVSLGGMEQYVLVRGMNTDNPVIIYLHGGPSSPDTYATYGFSDELIDEYTVVAWDQRGCGRTYFHNIDTDSENTTASFEQAQEDLDELVDYVRERFGKEQVIILGHSYGTILGSEYALEHPDKVSAYIGVAQVVSLEKTEVYSYEDALQKAIKADDDTAELTNAFEKFQDSDSLIDMLQLRSLVSAYHPVDVSDKATWMAITSPYYGMDDFRWLLKQLGNLEDYFSLNRQLFDYTMAFDAYHNGLTYEMPVYFISGTCDWICPVDSIKEYSETITAPEVRMELIEGCGHEVQYSLTSDFADVVLNLLDGIE
jgi:pimeloyl-ACP methyl ester carboxylesterase